LDRKNRDLAAHPIQLQILDEISLQLDTFAKYAHKIGRADVAAIYERQLRIIDAIRQQPQKVELFERAANQFSGSYLEKDRVFGAITEELGQFQ
jgi:hypothetical protein